MNITALALRNPWIIAALSVLVVALGVFAFWRVPTDLFPETAPPQVAVMTVKPGASAEDMADKITAVMEKELKSISGLKRLTSTSRDEVSAVTAEFYYAKPIGEAVVDVQNSISRIRGQFPAGTQEPLLFRVTDATRPLLTLALTPHADSGKNLSDIRILAENQLKDRFLAIEGIADVEVFGGYQPEVSIRIEREALHAHALTIQEVMNAVARQNVSAPGGTLYTGAWEHLLRIGGEFIDLAALEQLPLPSQGGAKIELGDIAHIEVAQADMRSFYHGNGKSAIALNILRAEGGHTVAAIKNLKQALPKIEAEFGDITFSITDDQQPLIDLNVSGMRSSLVQAVILTVFIILLFLANIRAAAVVSFSIPLAFLSAMTVLWFSPFTLNMVTLSGLIISVGMVVDASVVVLENIYRHHETNPDIDAALISKNGAREVAAPVSAGMLTTVVVLFPVLFSSGYTGTVMRPLNLMIIVTLIASLLISLTVVPLLTSWLLRRRKPEITAPLEEKAAHTSTAPKQRPRSLDKALDGIARFYLNFVQLALRQRTLFLLLALVFIGFTFRGVRPLLGGEQMPPMDTGISIVEFDTSASLAPSAVEEVLQEVEAIIQADAAVTAISSVVGSEPAAISFGGGGAPAQSARLTVHMVPRTERTRTIWEIGAEWRTALRQVAGIKSVRVSEYGATPVSTTKAPFNLIIAGPDARVLDQLAHQALQQLEQVPGLTDLRRSWHMDKLQQNIIIDPEVARLFGTSPAALGENVRNAVQGGIASSMRLEQFLDIPIRVRYAAADTALRTDLDEIYISVNPQNGVPVAVPLSALASIEPEYTRPFETRDNLRTTIDITAGNAVLTIAEVTAKAQQALKGLSLPAGYELEMAGSVRDMQESQAELGRALAVGMVLLFTLLMALFRSVVHPITVMLSIPLAVAGAVWGLLLFNKPMCMPAMMGIILLGGTIVNNAILMLDFILNARLNGMEKNAAILRAVELRLRPILMTALSTVVGFSPLIFEMAVGLERMSPLGIAAASGLILGTVVTLVYVPVLYSVFDSASVHLRHLFFRARPGSVVVLLLAPLALSTLNPTLVSAQESRRAPVLSLDGAIKRALQYNPSLTQIEAQVEVSNAEVDLSRSPLRPRLDLAAQSVWHEEEQSMIPGLAPGNQSFANNLHQLTLEASYLLTDFGRLRATLNASLARAHASASDYQRKRQELIYIVAQTYLEVLTLEQLKTAANSSRASLQELEHNIQVQLEQGRAAHLDLLKAQTSVAHADALLSEYRGSLRARKAALAALLGLEPWQLPPLDTDPVLPAVSAGLEHASGDQRPDLTAAQQKLLAAEAALTSAERRYLPEVRLFASAGWYGADDFGTVSGVTPAGTDGFEDNYSVGIRVQVPLFDGGMRRAEVRKSEAETRAATAQILALQLMVYQELEEARSALESAEASVEAYTRAHAAAREALRIEKLKYASGKGVINDVLDAEASVLEAKASLSRARHSLASAGIQYRLACGTLDAQIAQEI